MNNRSGQTMQPSVSFYIGANRLDRIHLAVDIDYAVTIAGRAGPERIRRLRDSRELDVPILFDGLGYTNSGKPLDVDDWVASQRSAGADRVLLPGVILDWDANDNSYFTAVADAQAAIARHHEATVVLAIDSRWLRKKSGFLRDTFASIAQPIALVLVDSADPLEHGQAVEGIRMLAASVEQLSLLRTDHGGIGFVAFGGDHAALGLMSSHRHFSNGGGGGKPNNQFSRLFVRPMMDWFTADVVAAWSAAGYDRHCTLTGCDGRDLNRFLDADMNPDRHNLHALADLADLVLSPDRYDRSRVFIEACVAAVDRHEAAGLDKLKGQLVSWSLR